MTCATSGSGGDQSGRTAIDFQELAQGITEQQRGGDRAGGKDRAVGARAQHDAREAGGLTRAAQRLMVSQPAISLQVAELETALKAKLFDRLPRGVRLTAAGELLLGYAADRLA